MKQPDILTMDMNKANESLVQYSEKVILNKKTLLTVPRDYIALIFIDGKSMFKNAQCVNANIVNDIVRTKEFIGHEIQVAFYSKNYVAEILYGFGGINVNNERLKEAYRVGINGQMMIKIDNYVNLIKNFSSDEKITIEDIRERLLPVIKTVGIPVVSKCFANTNVSVFEINAMLDDIRDAMFKAFEKEPAFINLGIEIQSLAINGIHVPDEDLEMIRDRINN